MVGVIDRLELVAYLVATVLLAVAGVAAVRAGLRNLRVAWRLRDRPLLHGIDSSRLEVASSEPWPTSGRWPGPRHHSEEFRDARRRAVYRTLALDKALSLSLASELILLLSAAYLGYALPRALSRLGDLPGPVRAPAGTRTVVPDSVVTDLLAALWPVVATLAFVFVALVLRARSGRLRRLAHMYLDPGDVDTAPTLWLPPASRRSHRRGQQTVKSSGVRRV